MAGSWIQEDAPLDKVLGRQDICKWKQCWELVLRGQGSWQLTQQILGTTKSIVEGLPGDSQVQGPDDRVSCTHPHCYPLPSHTASSIVVQGLQSPMGGFWNRSEQLDDSIPFSHRERTTLHNPS